MAALATGRKYHCDICFDLRPEESPDRSERVVFEKSATDGCLTCALVANVCSTFRPEWAYFIWKRPALEKDESPSAFHDCSLFDWEEKSLGEKIVLHCVPSGTSPWRQEGRQFPETVTTMYSYANTIRSFLETCETEHPLCQSAVRGYIPTRLLYVGRSTPTDLPVLCETTVDLDIPYGKGGSYIALSHCWGNIAMVTTTKATLSDRKKGIPMSSLSLTFQESISITRALNVDYIWIDSLCIVQDDAEDWALEASRMAAVYESSYLTVGATRAASGNDGLFPRQRPSVSKYDVMVGDTSYDLYIWEAVRGGLHPDKGIWNMMRLAEPESNTPLCQRAWAFQERVLSRRF